MAQLSKVIHIKVTETTFILSGIDFSTKKLEIYGPNFGWFISQSYQRLFPFRKRAAARSNNGVVGKTGRNIPRIARPNDRKPKTVSNIFILNSPYSRTQLSLEQSRTLLKTDQVQQILKAATTNEASEH